MADERLERLAYRLLGSVEDAEDVVQDARVRLLALEHTPDNVDAYLFRVVANLAIDRLRRRKVERRTYPGPWLPEPLATPHAGEVEAARRDDLSVGLLLLLETVSASERVAFVLREAYELTFQEIGELLDIGTDACRQRYHRARRKLAARVPTSAPPEQHRRVLERLVDAVAAGDPEAVAELLTGDALLVTDGGGRVSAAVRPVAAPERIARVLVHLASREDLGDLRREFRALNDSTGLVLIRDLPKGGAELYGCVQLEVRGEQVSRIFVVRNPTKLKRLSAGSVVT
ncbi:MAG: sigma-70 family RNA polymerase sigma factor [Pseudomonadota bacterium]